MKCLVCDSELIESKSTERYLMRCVLDKHHYHYEIIGNYYRLCELIIPYDNEKYFISCGYGILLIYKGIGVEGNLKRLIISTEEIKVPIERKYLDLKPLLIKLLKMKAFI